MTPAELPSKAAGLRLAGEGQNRKFVRLIGADARPLPNLHYTTKRKMLFGWLRFFCVASIQNALHVVDMDDVADVIAHDLLAWHGVALEDMVEAHEDELEYDDDGAYWPDDGIRHFMMVWFDPHEHHEAREHWPGFFNAFTKWLPAGEPALAMELVRVSGREYENAMRLHRR